MYEDFIYAPHRFRQAYPTGLKIAIMPFEDLRETRVRGNLGWAKLPLGVLVGTVEIVASTPCRPGDAAAACVGASDLKDQIAWRLENPLRFDEPMPVRYLPYGVWFYPFRRRSQSK